MFLSTISHFLGFARDRLPSANSDEPSRAIDLYKSPGIKPQSSESKGYKLIHLPPVKFYYARRLYKLRVSPQNTKQDARTNRVKFVETEKNPRPFRCPVME